MKQIEIGFEMETGRPVTIEPNHTFIAGTTGTGKSKAMQRLIKGADGHVLIIDAKRKRDYAGLNADIALYIKQQMEPIVIKDSIETTERFTIKQQFGTLLDTVAESESWDDMLEVINREMKTVRSGYIKNNLKILRYFIKRLVKEHEKFLWSDELNLNNGISVLDVSRMSIQMQQLVVGSAINYIQDHLTDITVIIDEAHRFVPQGQTSGCSRDIVTYIREGRASSNWMWLADQTVTGISKDLLKQMQYWVLGRQSELNEAQRTVKQIPRAKTLGVNIEEIQTLGLGEFLIVCPDWAKKTYIWPLWINAETAKKVALGEMTAKQVARQEKKTIGDDDLLWKTRYEEEHRARLDIKKELEFYKTDDLSRENARKTIMHYKDNAQTWGSEQMKLNREIEELKKQVKAKGDPKEVKKLKVQISDLTKNLEEAKKGFTRTLGNRDNEIERLTKATLEFQEMAEEYDTVNGAIDALRKILGTPNQFAGMVNEDAIVKRVLAKVGTGGTVTITEDIELGKHFQLRAYNTTLEQMDALTMEQVKILGWLMHVDKGVTRLELIKGIYQKDNLMGQASKKLTDNLEALKAAGLVRAGGGRIHANAIALVTEQLELVDATDAEINQILAKVKGFIAKKLSAA